MQYTGVAEVIHEFGPFRYDPEQRLLFRDGEMVSLMPKAIDTLHVLLERRGRVVEKRELMKLVWPDTVVEEVGLARNISLLRKALGDEGGEAEYIETIPRRGYRFVAAGAAAPVVRRVPWWALAAVGAMALAGLIYWQFYTPSRFLTRGAGVAGLAVVPFESLTPELDRANFARGLSDSLVADLSQQAGLQVVSPSTVRRHQWIGMSMGLMGRLLGLEVLVEGTVQRSGDRVTITARLVDVHTGKVIWAENYQHPAADLGQVQLQAAREIAAQVGAHLAIHGRFPGSGR